MSFHKVECVLLECDNCGDHYEDGHGFAIFVDEGSVNPEDDDWHEIDGKHYCPDCHTIDDDDNLIIKTERKKVIH